MKWAELRSAWLHHHHSHRFITYLHFTQEQELNLVLCSLFYHIIIIMQWSNKEEPRAAHS